MQVAIVTLDLGNSSAKLTITRGPKGFVFQTFEFPTDFELAGRIVGACSELGRTTAVSISCVAARDIEADVVAALRQNFDHVLLRPDPGLEIGLNEPTKIGSDRLYAARAAHEFVHGSAVVIDAGTALTVDAIVANPAGRPRFLGGAIAPGPTLLARALAEGTARLPLVDVRATSPAIGRDTVAALHAGISVGFRGAVRELVASVAREAGIECAPAVLTGGARHLILEPPLQLDRALHVVPDLVHQGLVWALPPQFEST